MKLPPRPEEAGPLLRDAAGPDVLDARRAPRLPLRLVVELRHQRARWTAETDDVGPRGCQVVTTRGLPEGRDVALALECPALGRTVAATGRVAWARAEAPARLGISFEVGVADRDWFTELLRAGRGDGHPALRAPLRLQREAALHLGEPPAAVVDFSSDELAVLRAIGPGATVGELAEALAGRFHRARGALFSLLARRLVLLQPGPAGAAGRWREILAPPRAADPLAPPRRPAAAERLYQEGIAHLGSGRVDLALARFREALEVVPGDEPILGTLARLERWR